MSNPPTIEELVARVSELEQKLEELSSGVKPLSSLKVNGPTEVTGQLTSNSLKVDGPAAVTGELTAGSFREGEKALSEKYQVKDEAVSAPSLTVTGNATIKGEMAAQSIKEGGQMLGEKYQPRGNYLRSDGNGTLKGGLDVKGRIHADVTRLSGAAGRDALHLSANPSEEFCAVISRTHERLVFYCAKTESPAALTGKSFDAVSDLRLKENIAPLTDVLDKIQALRGVSFEWSGESEESDTAPDGREIGVIAQEVESVFPELVRSTEDGGYKMLDYGRLTPILIEALKELRREKDQQIVDLRGQLHLLAQQISVGQTTGFTTTA